MFYKGIEYELVNGVYEPVDTTVNLVVEQPSYKTQPISTVSGNSSTTILTGKSSSTVVLVSPTNP